MLFDVFCMAGGVQELEDNASRVTEEMADDDDDVVDSKSAESAEAKGTESAESS